jgi:hypothetical protein
MEAAAESLRDMDGHGPVSGRFGGDNGESGEVREEDEMAGCE